MVYANALAPLRRQAPSAYRVGSFGANSLNDLRARPRRLEGMGQVRPTIVNGSPESGGPVPGRATLASTMLLSDRDLRTPVMTLRAVLPGHPAVATRTPLRVG
jgi:hypothetical protein